MLDKLLSNFQSNINISDILLTQWDFITIRLAGDINKIENKVNTEQIDQIIKEILDQNNIWPITTLLNEIDVWYIHDDQSYRINIFQKSWKKALAIRKLTNFDISLEDVMTIDLAKTIQEKVLKKKSGLFLVTGTAWSGKSTTLIWCLEYLNQTYPKHIITIEDPREYIFKPKKSVFSQREVGLDTVSFESWLKSLLRQNPDELWCEKSAILYQQKLLSISQRRDILCFLLSIPSQP